MRQLVQLQKFAPKFEELNAELVFVFREEGDGVPALKTMKTKYNTKFRLTIDPRKKSTSAYSSGRMKFDNYVIDSSGKIRGVVDGTLRDRATADELLKILGSISK